MSNMDAPGRIWLVLGDHSVLGVWTTRRKAETAMRLGQSGSLLEVEFRVVGPYVLQRGSR